MEAKRFNKGTKEHKYKGERNNWENIEQKKKLMQKMMNK